MSKDEIIDKVKDIACYGDEFQAIYFKIGRLKAVTACTQSYCNNIPDGGTPHIYIMSMLELIAELAVEIDNGLDKGIQLIIDTTSETTSEQINSVEQVSKLISAEIR